MIDYASHDPDKVSYNSSIYNLTESEKSLLIKGSTFPFHLRKLSPELLYHDKKSSSQPTVDVASKNARLKDTAFTSYSVFDRNTSSS